MSSFSFLSTLANILQVVLPIRMNFVASLPVPRYLSVRFLAPALALLSEASGVSSASLERRLLTDQVDYWFLPEDSRNGIHFDGQPIRPRRGFPQYPGGQHCKPGRRRYVGRQTSTDSFSNQRGVWRLRCKGNTCRDLDEAKACVPEYRSRGEAMRLNLMISSPISLVRASAIKLSEERLRQARNQNNRVQENRYSTQSFYFFVENSFSACKTKKGKEDSCVS